MRGALLFDGLDLVDAILGGSSWILGAALVGVASSVVGLAVWLGVRTDPRGLAPVLGRAALGFGGCLALGAGLVLVSVGTETLLGFPLGQNSGGGSLVGYWLACKVLFVDASVGAGLALRLHRRSGEALHQVVAWLAYAWAAGVWTLGKIMLLLVVIVAIGTALA